MDINTQKEEFSYAYIYAVASAAGCICQRTTTPLDQLGVDLITAYSRFMKYSSSSL
ncbi:MULTISPECIES: hypothetical protein [unclassified Microcoleus]|uniref:hypothetical protein n=1 Tax=unclassified Microcoleus TaxID=2642155 RepID=UPI002FD53B03